MCEFYNSLQQLCNFLGGKTLIFVRWKYFHKLKKWKMKKTTMFLFSVAALLCFTQCNNPTPTATLQQADTRGKTISALMNNDTYMKEVMDSMKTKHGGAMSMDMPMDENMMNKMMEKCKNDPAMCKMMMDKTMAMCNADSAMCKMMMTSMQPHPNVMKSMQGMCDMKGMKMDKKK